MRSKNIEALLYSKVFMQYEEFCELLQMTIIAAIYDTSQDVSEVSLLNLRYICTLLELLFYSESNGVIFNFVHQHNHKSWPYN